MKTRTGTAVAFALMLLTPLAALAQEEQDTSWVKSQGNRVGLEVDLLSYGQSFFGTDITVLGLAFTAVAQIEIVDKIYLDAELPLGFGSLSISNENNDDSESGFVLGNPTVGAHYADALKTDSGLEIAYFFGGALSAPVIFDPEDEAAIAVLANLPSRAYFDLHRFAPETLPIRLRGGAEIRILPYLLYRGDFSPVSYIPLDTGDFELVVEQGNEIEARTEGGFGGGLRLQEAFPLTDNDLIQLAVEPFVAYEPQAPGLYARAGFLIALDEGLGFGFDEGKVATLRLAVGGKF